MPTGTCIIYNYQTQTNKNIYDEFSVSLSDGAVSALLAPPAVKERITNESRLQNGKRYDTSTTVYYQQRELTLEMHLIASTFSELTSKFNAFIEFISSPPAGIILALTIYGKTLRYQLRYLSCTTFAQYGGTLAKFAVRFVERNPNNGSASLSMTSD